MIAAVDIGGTKTLVAVFNSSGEIVKKERIPTNQNYKDFLKEFRQTTASLKIKSFNRAGVAIPGVVDRENGVGKSFGNLAWKNVPIQDDMERILGCPVALENDAKAAALSEAKLIMDEFKRVLYITIGTGIGIAYVDNGVIDTSLGDRGGNRIQVEHGGKIVSWESIASGKAIVKRFGKKASDITEEKTWKIIAHDFGLGIWNLVALLGPDVIIIGGGVGSHFDRFKGPLKAELKQYDTPVLPAPPFRKAQRPEEAVVYGCYELARGLYGRAHK